MARKKVAAKKRKRAGKKSAAVYSFAGEGSPLHELFRRSAERIVAATDASEDEKQRMLLAMNCPCCGLGASSFRIKLGPGARFIAD